MPPTDGSPAAVPTAAGALAAAAAGLLLLAVAPVLTAWRQPPVAVFAALATATAVGLVLAAVRVARRGVSGARAELLAIVAVFLAAAGGLGRLLLTGDPQASLLVLLAMVGTGLVVVRREWLLAVLVALAVAWLAALPLVGPHPAWPGYALALPVAAGLAWLANALRRGEADRFHRLHATAAAAAVRDAVTGLANRAGLELMGRQVLETARRHGDAAHCAHVVVDGGDDDVEVSAVTCRAVGDALRAVTRSTDVVASWEDRVFCIVGLGTGVAAVELERRVGRRLREAVAGGVTAGLPRVTAGVAVLTPWDDGDLEALLRRAAAEAQARLALRGGAPRPRPDATGRTPGPGAARRPPGR